jgi:hypothetical protein
MPAIFENRDAILQQLEHSERAAAELIAGLSPLQVNWKPNGVVSWSICQCLDHLARTNRIYCQAMLESIAHLRPGISGTIAATPGWFGRLFIGKMEPPVRARFKAAKKVIPAADGDAKVPLRDFVNSHSEVRRVIGSWERMDFNRVRFRNPFVPLLRFTVATGLLIINAHDRRHLWQAERVKASEGFPAA